MKMSVWRIPYQYVSPLKIVLVLLVSALLFCGCINESSCSDCEGPTFYTFYAINPNGTLKWNYTMKNMAPTSPAIGQDGTIYFSSTYQSSFGYGSSLLFAMSPTGSVIWEIALSNRGENSSAPVIGTDGTIYVPCSDVGTLCDIKPDGALQWTYATNYPIFSSPAVGSNGMIYLTDNGSLYALSPTGALQWSDSTESFSSTPAIGSNDVIYIEAGNNMLYAFSSTGVLQFSSTIFNGTDYFAFASPPVIAPDGTIYLTLRGNIANTLYAVNPDGTFQWTREFGAYSVFGSPPAIGIDGTIYVDFYDAVPNKNMLYAINPAGGLNWSYTTQSDGCSSVVSSNGTIYIVFDNKLYALNSNGTLRWQISVVGAVNTLPVVAPDGTIYFSTWHK